LWVILYAFCAGALVGGVIALVMIGLRRQFRRNLEHTRVILLDMMTLGNVEAMAKKANERRPRWHRLPYGVPLCLGFVGYLWYAGNTLPPPGAPTAEERPIQHMGPVGVGPTYCLDTRAAEQPPATGPSARHIRQIGTNRHIENI
jgi:hypothetical protein